MATAHLGLSRGPDEAVFVLYGRGAARVAQELLHAQATPSLLVYVTWQAEAPPAAVTWVPPDRLEVRIPAEGPWPELMRAHLLALGADDGHGSWHQRLREAIALLESWSDSDTDPGGGMEELAAELLALYDAAPSDQARLAITSARDALDDGLPPDVIAAGLYRAGGL